MIKQFYKKKQQITELKERNKYLKNEIYKYEELEKFEERNIFCSKHLYGELYFKRLPLSYINTSFYYYAYDLYPLVNCTFEHFVLEQLFEVLHISIKDPIILSFALLCIGVKPSKDGPILILEEPFMTLQTRPLSKTSLHRAKSWVGRILIVDLTISIESFRKKEFEANRIQSTTITKHGKIGKDGIEHPLKRGYAIKQVKKNNQISICKKCDKSILEVYKDTTGKDECITALDKLEAIYLDKCIIPPFRQNKTTLWIRFEYEAMGIFYYNNRLEIVYEPKDDINTLYKPDGSLDFYKEIEVYMSSYGSTEFITIDKKIKKIKEDECMVKSYSDLLRIYKN